MRAGWALLPLMLAATPAAARFAPATDAPYRLAMTMERDDGRTVRRFATDYDVIFTRTGEGYRATLRARPDNTVDSGGTANFARLQSALADVPVVVRLDRSGRLIAVEDIDPLWGRLRAAIAATGGETEAGRAARRQLLGLHDAATSAMRAQTLAGDLLALCAGADADRRDAGRATTLPGSDGSTLPVREIVTREPDAIVIVTQDDAGTLVRRRAIDRRDGLVRDMTERRRITVRVGDKTRTATTLRTARLSPMVFRYPSETARKP